MHIRRCVSSDIPIAAELSANALRDQEHFDFLCPRRREFPNDFQNSFRRRITARHYSPGWVLWVAVTDADDEGKEDGKIVGYAAWERRGDGEDAKRWRETGWLWGIWCNIQRYIATTQTRLVNALGWDRAVDKAALARFDEYATENFLPSVSPEMWYLATLAVDQAHQRRGIGGTLLDWGVQRAKAEAVPVGLEASETGVNLYEKAGFKTVREWEWREGILSPIMVWEPEGLTVKESWVERAKRMVEDKKTV